MSGAPPIGAGFFSGRSAIIASGGDQQAGDRGRILQSATHDLRGVDDAGLHQVLEFRRLGVVTPVGALAFQQLAGNDGTIDAGILGDLTDRRLQRAADDLDTDLLVVVVDLHLVERT